MDFALFNMEGVSFVFRWLHFFFGVLWIGLLYYFNFVQGAFMAEADAATKSAATQKLVPRALWWFRWAAMYTWVTGWLIIGMRAHGAPGVLTGSWGTIILTGAAFGTVMWANVWFVIWPNQKVVIGSAVAAASGGQANPKAPEHAAKALRASRHNVLFSIPMLFFMGAAGHLAVNVNSNSNFTLYWIVMLGLLTGLEINALKGKLGPLTTVKGVITSGFVLAFGLYILMEVIL